MAYDDGYFENMVERNLASELIRAAARTPAVMVTGPRQSGKTTLCRALFPGHRYRTLEAPDDRALATGATRAFLDRFPNGAVLGEVQRVPGLLSQLRGIIEEDPVPGRWILTSSRDLRVRQSMAGRMAVFRLLPLTWNEVTRFGAHPASLDEVMFSGGYPPILDHRLDPSAWLSLYVTDYIERDVRTITNVSDLTTFQCFVEACAHRTARLLNYSSLAADCGISQPTAKAWLSILETSFLTFRLPAFRDVPGKRLVKASKLYFHDVGLACWLLGIREPGQLGSHPLRGTVFENWVVSEVVKHRANRADARGLWFYRDRNGAEADLVIEGPGGVTLVDVNVDPTFSAALFGGVERVRRHFKSLPAPEVGVVYGGEAYRSRSFGAWLVPWWRAREAVFR